MRKTKLTPLLLTLAIVLFFLSWANVPTAEAQKSDRQDTPKADSYEMHFKFKEKSALMHAEELLKSRAEAIGGVVSMIGEGEIILSLPKPGKKAQDKASISAGNNEAEDTVTTSTYSSSPPTLFNKLKALQGDGAPTSPYLISTAQDLNSIRNTVSEAAHYKLINDIDLSGFGEWTPIGDYGNEFNGVFDGNNHVISGMYINSGIECLGLFGCAGSASEINNIGLKNIYVSSTGDFVNIGGLVGYTEGSVNNCHASGSVFCSGYAINIGGLVGYTRGSISNSYATGSASCTGDSFANNFGGLVGYANSSIGNSHATGSVLCTGNLNSSNIGGLTGYAYDFICNSYATGSVSCAGISDNSNFGGLAGISNDSVINSYTAGNISGSGEYSYFGGLVGCADGDISNSYWDIDTTGQTSCTGNGNDGNSGDNGRHTQQMKQKATFTGWDFNTIWLINEGYSYPYFLEANNTTSKETLGKCPYCFFGRNSVNLSTGNFIFEQTDLSVPTPGPSLEFTRFYNSQDNYTGPQGKGWTNNYNVHLKLNQDGSISVAYADGHVYIFNVAGSGYTHPASCFETLSAGPGNGYTLIFKDHTKYIFDSTGQLINITDQNGNAITLAYSDGLLALANNQLTGHNLTFTYYSNNRLASIADQANRTVIFSYDTNGNLAEVQNARGGITRYSYDVHGLTEIVQPNGNDILSNTYDDSNRIIEQKDAKNNTWEFTYSPDQRTQMTGPKNDVITCACDDKYRAILLKDPLNNTTTYAYDNDNNCVSITDALGHNYSCTYDDNGNMTTSTDAFGATEYEYDNNNNLIKVTDTANRETRYTYDANNNLTSIINPDNKTTSFEYQSNGLLFKKTNPGTEAGQGTTIYTYQNGLLHRITDPVGVITTYNYDSAGRLQSISDKDNRATSFAYDNTGNLLSITDPMNNTVSHTYDLNSNLLTETDAKNNTTHFSYDENNLLISKTDALNNITRYEYDNENHLAKVTDARGNATSFDYDLKGRRISTTDPLGNTTVYSYDAMDNIANIKDAYGETISTYSYDQLYNVSSITDALGNTTSFTYDNAKRCLSEVEDSKNRTTNLTHDILNRLIKVKDPMQNYSAQSFDPDSNRTSMEDPNNNRNEFQYDEADRLNKAVLPTGKSLPYTYDDRGLLVQTSNGRGQSTTYQYDDNGRLISFADPAGTVSYTYDPNGNVITVTDPKGTITREYDDLDRVIKYIDTQGNIIRYTYDQVGNLITLTYPGDKQVHYGYNAANQLVGVTDWANRITTYEYDKNGMLTKTTRPDGSVQTISYDDAGQLREQKDIDKNNIIISRYVLTYDKTGNITKEETDIQTKPFTPSNAEIAYDSVDNRATSYNKQPISYDDDGNMTNGPLEGQMLDYAYDSRSRLTAVGNTSYQYDAENNRVSVTEGNSATHYVINPHAPLSQVLIKTDSQGNQIFYVYGVGLIGQQGGSYLTYHFDYRGNTVALTDANGNIADRFQYSPYGELQDHSGVTLTPFQFDGKDGVMTDGNGICYMRARYYLPCIGRFISRDNYIGRITDPLSLNYYTYCKNNPLIYVDPNGLEYIVVSGGKYSSGDGYKYNFIEPAIKKIRELREGNSKESIAWLIANAGWSDDDWKNYSSSVEGLNINIVKIGSKNDLIFYINNKIGGNSRTNDKITKFVVFSHGWRGTVSLGYNYNPSYNKNLDFNNSDIEMINGNAFNNPNSWFGSCNTGTGGSESFAQLWVNKVEGKTWAFEGQTTYAYIMYPKGYKGWLPGWWSTKKAIKNARKAYGFSASGSARYPEAANGARLVTFIR